MDEWDGHNFLYKYTKRAGHLKCETGSACQKLYCIFLGEEAQVVTHTMSEYVTNKAYRKI